jgi:hypothetical protein
MATESDPSDEETPVHYFGVTEKSIERFLKTDPATDYRQGRTTNEVLYDAGQGEAFYKAFKVHDWPAMIEALMNSGVPREEAEEIVATCRKHPENYGY